MSIKNFKFFLLLGTILILTGCQSTWRQPFPDAEIVYQGSYVPKMGYADYKVGFVNADGSNAIQLKTGMVHEFTLGSHLIKPVWGVDNVEIYALKLDTIQIDSGYAAYWEEGRVLKYCKNWYLPEQIQGLDSGKALINFNRKKVLIVDLAKCKEDRTLVDYSDSPFALKINGISYSSNHDILLFGLVNESLGTYDLMSLDITTGETNVLGQGLNPTWSPDGTQIAYVQTDGIYVMNKDGTQGRKVLTPNIPFIDEKLWDTSSAPIPSWSPDGEWLVYHRCSNREYVCSIDESAIYKVEVASGKEVKIVDGGIFPDWKK